MTGGTWKMLVAVCTAMVLGSMSQVCAAPVSYNFSITADEGSATGNFVGDDLDSGGSISLAEVLSFSVNATGTSFTGGPIIIPAADAVLSLFSFNLNALALSFRATNGLTVGQPNARGVGCDPCTVGSNFVVFLDGFVSERDLTAISVNQVSAVPEPASIALIGLALAGLGLSRRRMH